MPYFPDHIIISGIHMSILAFRICLLAHHLENSPLKECLLGLFLSKVCPFFNAFKSIMLVDKTLLMKVENDLHYRNVL